MGVKVLYDEPFLSIEHDTRGFFYLNWKGYLTVEWVKVGCAAILATSIEKNCFTWLNDNRQLSGTWTQAVRWLSDVFIPDVLKHSKLRIAFIYSPSVAARHSVDRLLEENDQFTAQTFEEYLPAETWLLYDRTTPFSGREISTISLRDQHRLYIINIDEINYIVANGKFVLVNTIHGTQDFKCTLESIERQVKHARLLRVHRSYIINLNLVSHIAYNAGGSYFAFLKNKENTKIPVSRSYAAQLKKALGITTR